MIKKANAQNPEKYTGIELKEIPHSAVGFKAIKSSINHVKMKQDYLEELVY